MPNFNIEQTITTELEIECWCNECREGICNNCDPIQKGSSYLLKITPCDCMYNKIDELEKKIEALEMEIENLNSKELV